MGERHVGLDIGSFGVRAAEVSIEGGSPVLHRFAQLTLPPRSVVEGEIVDPTAVAGTIRQLWEKGGFKATKVVVGVSTDSVKVRQAEVPALSADEIRSTLRYEAQDLIPVSDTDAVVDFLVQQHFTRDGAEMQQVLVVAAPRSHIDSTVAAVAGAGLEVEGVDLMPFALVRSLATRGEPGAGEVIVSVGAGLTSVVVHVDGVPQLVRTTAGGGSAITDALAERLSVGYEQAEAIKRSASPATPEGQAATTLIDEQLGLLVREIVGSVDYFVAQTAGVEIRRIILTGSGSLVPGLRERIRAESNLDVIPADALRNVTLGKTRLSPEQLVTASTTLAGPIGLALAPASDPGSRLGGLLPDSYVKRLATRREGKVVVAALVALAVGLLGLWGQRTFTLHSADRAVSREQSLRMVLVAKDASYQPYAAQDSDLIRRSTLVKSALTSDVDPAGLLDQITAAMPQDVWLESVDLVMPKGKGAGKVSFTLGGVDASSAAHWLSSMRALNSVFTTVWVSGITVSPTPHGGITFSSTANLSSTVVSNRAAKFTVPK